MNNIEKNSFVPLYHQLEEMLRDQVQNELKPGDVIPTEQELCEKYSISRTTVRNAILQLVSEGLLHRERGRGTFVIRPRIETQVMKITSFTEDMRSRGLRPSTKVLDVRSIPIPENTAKKYGIDPSEDVVKIHRLRSADDEPLTLDTSLIRRRFCPDLEKLDVASRSLTDILADNYGIHLTSAKQSIRASVANEYEAKLLDIPEGAPVLLIERVSFSGGDCVEFYKSVYRGDRYTLYVDLVADQKS